MIFPNALAIDTPRSQTFVFFEIAGTTVKMHQHGQSTIHSHNHNLFFQTIVGVVFSQSTKNISQIKSTSINSTYDEFYRQNFGSVGQIRGQKACRKQPSTTTNIRGVIRFVVGISIAIIVDENQQPWNKNVFQYQQTDISANGGLVPTREGTTTEQPIQYCD